MIPTLHSMSESTFFTPVAGIDLVRIRLDLRYDGTYFHGWAIQPGLRTVAGEVTVALEKIFRQAINLTVAGRTDAGVHAAHNVVHFDLPRQAWEKVTGRSTLAPSEALLRKVNALLAHNATGPRGFSDVVVFQAEEVSADFDARFSALSRRYTYRIADNLQSWNPQRRDELWLSQTLDLDSMNMAAQTLLGEHDFLSFCKPRVGASTVRTLQRLDFIRESNGIIVGTAQADAFCHSQVRTLMGTLIAIGKGERPVTWAAQRLAEQCRDGQVIVAAPHPLSLAEISYPAPSEYGVQAEKARRFRGA